MSSPSSQPVALTTRRSGRIACEVPIVLSGTDVTGRYFAEETVTVVLSRHGAGVISRNKFAPDEPLYLRVMEKDSVSPAREIQIRLVGQMGDEPRGFIYGVEFLNPPQNFWNLNFPPPEIFRSLPGKVALECSLCSTRELVEQSEIEADVYLISQRIFRNCPECGQTTPWRPASTSLRKLAKASARSAKDSDVARTWQPVSNSSLQLERATPHSSAYSGEFASVDFVPASVATIDPPAPTAAFSVKPSAASSSAPVAHTTSNGSAVRNESATPNEKAQLSGKNRRRHVRTRVTFTACIRTKASDEELVECENVSKGGVCFRSRRTYEIGAAIEVAAPFSPGEHAIFVRARVTRAQSLPAANLTKYGASYC